MTDGAEMEVRTDPSDRPWVIALAFYGERKGNSGFEALTEDGRRSTEDEAKMMRFATEVEALDYIAVHRSTILAHSRFPQPIYCALIY